MYGYSRGITPGGHSALRSYCRIETQISPQLFLVAEIELDADIMISRRIVSLDELRRCRLFSTHAELREWQELHFRLCETAAIRMQSNRIVI
jgi:hypothetical protein